MEGLRGIRPELMVAVKCLEATRGSRREVKAVICVEGMRGIRPKLKVDVSYLKGSQGPKVDPVTLAN